MSTLAWIVLAGFVAIVWVVANDAAVMAGKLDAISKQLQQISGQLSAINGHLEPPPDPEAFEKFKERVAKGLAETGS